jgi:CheY-like chemotaxis protein
MYQEECSNSVGILVVEDSPSDALLTREALAQAKLRNKLHLVEDGVEAMAFLRREGQYANAPRPHLILLDLNLPRKDGREVLAEVKADIDLRMIPVVVLTTSKVETDILKVYGLYANCYIVKPVDFQQFTDVVQSREHFWFTVVALPYLTGSQRLHPIGLPFCTEEGKLEGHAAPQEMDRATPTDRDGSPPARDGSAAVGAHDQARGNDGPDV